MTLWEGLRQYLDKLAGFLYNLSCCSFPLTIQLLQGFKDFLLCLCALAHEEKWLQICFPAHGREELWKQHLWETLAFHKFLKNTVLKNTLHLSKILKLALYYRASTELVFTSYIWIYYSLESIFLISVRITQALFKHRQDNKNMFHSNKAKSSLLDWKMENTFTKENHIKKIQMTDLTFRVLLFSTSYWVCQL